MFYGYSLYISFNKYDFPHPLKPVIILGNSFSLTEINFDKYGFLSIILSPFS